MTKEQQRIAIAKACGWRSIEVGEGITGYHDSVVSTNMFGQTVPLRCYIPDYLNDLNAMHEAEKVLDDRNRQCVRYAGELERVLARAHEKRLDPSRFGMIHATAAQRAEAFLKTLNLWKD